MKPGLFFVTYQDRKMRTLFRCRSFADVQANQILRLRKCEWGYSMTRWAFLRFTIVYFALSVFHPPILPYFQFFSVFASVFSLIHCKADSIISYRYSFFLSLPPTVISSHRSYHFSIPYLSLDTEVDSYLENISWCEYHSQCPKTFVT